MLYSRLAALYRRHFRDPRRERLFLASLCFFVTFGLARLATHYMRASSSPPVIFIGGTHVHHLFWGILLLLAVGYLWLAEPPAGSDRYWFGRMTSLLYGFAAALTLDEFALWFRLRDVYWDREGRASIDAVMLFGALVSAGLWGGPFVRAVGRHVVRPRLRAWVAAAWRAAARRGAALPPKPGPHAGPAGPTPDPVAGGLKPKP